MDHQAFIRSRRSVRQFQDQPVERDVLQRIIMTATRAPSAHNRQPWRFVVLDRPQARQKLVAAMQAAFADDLKRDGLSTQQIQRQLLRSRRRILGSPAPVLLCMDLTDMDSYPDARRQQAERQMAVQSVALAGGTLLLAAHAEGLGGVWICAPLFAPQAVQQALSLPQAWEPQALLLLGYPAEQPQERERRSLEEVVQFW